MEAVEPPEAEAAAVPVEPAVQQVLVEAEAVPMEAVVSAENGEVAAASTAFVQVAATTTVVEASMLTGGVEEEGGRSGGGKKNAWTKEEDAILTRVVATEGAGHWTKVAVHLPGRMGRQCRERWFNHLAPDVRKGDWTAHEDQRILAAVRLHGTKWSQIQRELPGRSDNSIKNRYYSAIRKAQRLEKRASHPLSVATHEDPEELVEAATTETEATAVAAAVVEAVAEVPAAPAEVQEEMPQA